MDASIVVDGLAVLWEEVLESVGSQVCLASRLAIAHRSAHAKKCLAKWRTVLGSPWVPRKLRWGIVTLTMWQASLWSSNVWTTVKAQRVKISSWSARMVANVIDVTWPYGWKWISGGLDTVGSRCAT